MIALKDEEPVSGRLVKVSQDGRYPFYAYYGKDNYCWELLSYDGVHLIRCNPDDQWELYI